jgi:hypothetical protein
MACQPEPQTLSPKPETLNPKPHPPATWHADSFARFCTPYSDMAY